MIEPVLSATALLTSITSASPAPGQIVVWRLGQSGVVCRFPGGITVVIDPYLSNHCEAVLPAPFDHRRMTRSPLDGSELAFADIIACTHDHLDHIDPPTIRSASRLDGRPTLVAPRPAGEVLAALGWTGEDVVLTDHGEQFDLCGLTLRAFAVPHESFDAGKAGYPFQGFTFSDGTVTIAHLGDTLDHERVRRSLREARPDLVFVPINGRDEKRAALGFAGNMNAGEAVRFASAIGDPVVVPLHYDMFAQNTDPDAAQNFRDEAVGARFEYYVLDVGEPALIDLGERREPK